MLIHRLLIVLWAVACTLGAGASFAQPQAPTCSIPDAAAAVADYRRALILARRDNCLGHVEADGHPLVKAFNAVTEQPTAMNQTQRLLAAVDLLVAEAVTGSAGADDAEIWKAMLVELSAIRTQLAGLQTVATPRAWLDAMERAIQPKWKEVATGTDETLLDGRPFNLNAPPACENARPCPAFQSRLGLIRVANLLARLQRYSQDSSLELQYAQSELALARWEAYRAKAHHQYIWEVAVNGLRMGRDLCPEEAGTGLRMGFCKVPDSQLILLHPEAALRWSRSATKASELKPAILIQLIGWYGWDWATVGGRETAELANRRGLSLAATYTSTPNEKRWAFGPMFHYGDYSLAVTKAGDGGKWSIVLNLSLGERYFGRKQQVVDELAKIRKTDVLDLLFK